MSQVPADRPEVPRQPSDAAKPLRPSPKLRPGAPPRFHLVLHHDPAADLMFVVRSVMELTRFPRAEATHKMWEAHHSGRSILFSTYRERGELFVELFTDKGLTVSIEPA
jgi:ATP-dependent Clp protease adapter protein ClpS